MHQCVSLVTFVLVIDDAAQGALHALYVVGKGWHVHVDDGLAKLFPQLGLEIEGHLILAFVHDFS